MTDPVQRLGQLARRRDGETNAFADRRSREAVVRALTAKKPKPWTLSQQLLAASCVVMAVMIVGLVWPEASLDYEVAGAVADDGYVRAHGEPARVTFEDGTSFALTEGSSGRIVNVGEDGAKVLLEQGEIAADVVPRTNAQWTVAAGPYSIAVTGTRFTVTWAPDAERFTVVLTEGSITVRGPMAEPGLAMRAGQRLVADVDGRDLKVTEGEPTASVAASTAMSSEAAPAPESAPAVPAPSATAAAPAVAWSQLIAEGKYQDVMSQARAMGVGAVLTGGSMEQLVALGDAARYTGDGATSRKVLLALRERFPTSGAAKTAAFLLGRMAEGGSASSAVTWYDRYLAESPGGTYASEALGRKMVVLSRSQPGAARAVAVRYLKLYPNGGYARVARQLTE